MTSEKLSGSDRRENTPVPQESVSPEDNMDAQNAGDIKETKEESVRGKIAMFEGIRTTDTADYHYNQKRAHRELSNFKIESIRRNFHHEPSPKIPIILPPLDEQKFRKISDSFLIQKRAVFDQCLTVDEKCVSNEEIAKTFSSEDGASDVPNNSMYLQVQNDENSISQTTLTSSTAEIDESAEINCPTEDKSKELDYLTLEPNDDNLAKIQFDIDDVCLEFPKEQMRVPLGMTRDSISDEKSNIIEGDCNVSLMTNGSSSTDGTYVSISVQVRSRLFAQNRCSDTSSGDYKYAIPPSTEPIYDRAMTDRESSSSSNSAILRKPMTEKFLQKQMKRSSSWNFGTSELEHQLGRFARNKRRHSLSVCSTKSSISDQGRTANSQAIVSSFPNNDSWSGFDSSSDFNNELNFSSTSDSSRSHIYDADDDESDPYDRPHQLFSENPYDTPSPNRPRSETTNTITHLAEQSSVDEIPEHIDNEPTKINLRESVVLKQLSIPKPPPIPARTLFQSDSNNADESSETKTATHLSDNNDAPLGISMIDEVNVLRNLPSDEIRDRFDRRRETQSTQIAFNPPCENSRSRKLSLAPFPSASVFEEQGKQDRKKKSKYKNMLFLFKRSKSVTVMSKEREGDEDFVFVDVGSSTSFEESVEPSSPGKPQKGFTKKFMRRMKGSKKTDKFE